MSLTKQAKILTEEQVRLLEADLPLKSKVKLHLSLYAGLRVKEISCLTWDMVLTPDGTVGTHINLPNSASKGKTSGRRIPINPILKQTLSYYHKRTGSPSTGRIVTASPNTLAHWFRDLYISNNLKGYSSHSGRRTFITNLARRCNDVGCSLRDVQQLAGHSSLQMTQRYIEENEEGKIELVNLLA